MSTIFQQETAFTAAPAASPPLPSILWVPLDEVRQAWASFGTEALSCPALLATSSAFAALSWETSALRHYGMAHHAQQGGFPPEAAAHWLDRVIQDLSEAVRDWRGVQLWLERLATATSSDTQEIRTEPVEQVRALSAQAAAQQQRLRHLLGQAQHEQGACGRGGQAAVAPVPDASAPAAVAAAGAQAEEEE